MYHQIPAGDVLIHAGDFTNVGSETDVTNFSNYLKTMDEKFKYKVVIAGNHELSFDPDHKRIHKVYVVSFKLKKCLKLMMYFLRLIN